MRGGPRRVSIFGCGVQKAGTTSLDAHLRDHPGLSAPWRKETHFFDDERRDWTTPDYRHLDAFYRDDDGTRARFDITPIYCFWPDAMARLAAYNREARLIFLFRDPFERALSQWTMERARGDETLPFSRAIREGRARLPPRRPRSRPWRVFSYLERGLYGAQVTRALAHFPPAQILFLRSEDLRDDHTATLARIAAFLDIASFPETGPKREHTRDAYRADPVWSDADLDHVAQVVGGDLMRFAAVTGLDIGAWPVARRLTDSRG